VALANSAPPRAEEVGGDAALALTGYRMPSPLELVSWLTSWRLDLLWTTVAALALGLYVTGAVRMARRGDGWPVLRTVSWVLGCLVLVWATGGAPGVYGRVLFSAHMLGHMTMSMVVPALLVLGAPVTLALRTLGARHDGSRGPREWLLAVVHSRVMAVLGHPLVAAGLFAGSLVTFYYSPLFELSLRTHTGHVLMHAHFLLVGYLFANVLIGIDPGPARPPYPMRLLLLFATMAFHAFFGVALVQGSQLLAPEVLASLGRTWGRSPLADSSTVARSPGGSASSRCCCSAWGSRSPGSARTTARRAGATGRPTGTARPSSASTTPGSPGWPDATTTEPLALPRRLAGAYVPEPVERPPPQPWRHGFLDEQVDSGRERERDSGSARCRRQGGELLVHSIDDTPAPVLVQHV
jgi:putative copper resistance protein D